MADYRVQSWWKKAAASLLRRSEYCLISRAQAYVAQADGSFTDFPAETIAFIPQLRFRDNRRPPNHLPDADHSLEIYQTLDPDIGYGLRTLLVSCSKALACPNERMPVLTVHLVYSRFLKAQGSSTLSRKCYRLSPPARPMSCS